MWCSLPGRRRATGPPAKRRSDSPPRSTREGGRHRPDSPAAVGRSRGTAWRQGDALAPIVGAPACCFGVDRATITRAVGEVRPPLATRGCTVVPGIRLRTLAEVIEHLRATRQTGIIDGIEIRVRRPAAGRKDRDKFISGKNKQNAVKAMVLTDSAGRLLFCSSAQPASCADITHARQLGLVKHLADGPVDGPSDQPFVGGLERAELVGQVPPGRVGAVLPRDGLERSAVISPPPSTDRNGRHQRLDPAPHRISDH